MFSGVGTMRLPRYLFADPRAGLLPVTPTVTLNWLVRGSFAWRTPREGHFSSKNEGLFTRCL